MFCEWVKSKRGKKLLFSVMVKDSNCIDLFKTIGDTVTSSRINHVCYIFTCLFPHCLPVSPLVFYMYNKFVFFVASSAPLAVIITMREVFTNDSAIIYISSTHWNRYLYIVVTVTAKNRRNTLTHQCINKHGKQTQSVQISVMKNWSRHLMSPSFSLISRCLSYSHELYARLFSVEVRMAFVGMYHGFACAYVIPRY